VGLDPAQCGLPRPFDGGLSPVDPLKSASRTAGVVILAALPWTGLLAEPLPPPQTAVRQGLVDLEGRPRNLDELRGSLVVVNFWATWCVPCRVEMPLFVEMARRRAGTGVVIVGAAADSQEEARRVRRFIDDLEIDFPIWLGATTEDMTRFGLGTALPATAILDRDGSVALRVDGVVDGEGLEGWIDWMLGDRTSPAPPAPIGRAPADGHEHHDHGDHGHGPGVGLDGPSLVPS
jgi:thiol-disulfide isomerase/thioredoxin